MKFTKFCVHSIKIIDECLSDAFLFLLGIYSNIIVYQKYIGTSVKVGCATRSLYASLCPKAKGVPTNNQRGRASGSCCL